MVAFRPEIECASTLRIKAVLRISIRILTHAIVLNSQHSDTYTLSNVTLHEKFEKSAATLAICTSVEAQSNPGWKITFPNPN